MTELVAILNVTPDSFSDGRPNTTPEDYVKLAASAVKAGATYIDIGAESTRPGAVPLTPDEEWARLEPVLSLLPPGMNISLDTRHPETLSKALVYGISWLNDVSGVHAPDIIALAKMHDFKVVLMHSITVPANPQNVLPDDCDVIEVLLDWGRRKLEALTAQGIARERFIFDPGLGFGKTAKQSWQILEQVDRLKKLRVPILIGHSRKSFMQVPMEERDAMTAKITAELAKAGVAYVRVHNVRANAKALTA